MATVCEQAEVAARELQGMGICDADGHGGPPGIAGLGAALAGLRDLTGEATDHANS